jgi:catechol-2,3-dioxygenase
MRSLNVTITAMELDAAAFYREVLGLPVAQGVEKAVLQVNSSQLTWASGDKFESAHHLAMGISLADFPFARPWQAMSWNP